MLALEACAVAPGWDIGAVMVDFFDVGPAMVGFGRDVVVVAFGAGTIVKGPAPSAFVAGFGAELFVVEAEASAVEVGFGAKLFLVDAEASAGRVAFGAKLLVGFDACTLGAGFEAGAAAAGFGAGLVSARGCRHCSSSYSESEAPSLSEDGDEGGSATSIEGTNLVVRTGRRWLMALSDGSAGRRVIEISGVSAISPCIDRTSRLVEFFGMLGCRLSLGMFTATWESMRGPCLSFSVRYGRCLSSWVALRFGDSPSRFTSGNSMAGLSAR